jgi:transposase
MHPTLKAVTKAQDSLVKAREARDKAIRASLAEGKTLRQVAAEFDCSAQFVKEVRDRA